MSKGLQKKYIQGLLPLEEYDTPYYQFHSTMNTIAQGWPSLIPRPLGVGGAWVRG